MLGEIATNVALFCFAWLVVLWSVWNSLDVTFSAEDEVTVGDLLYAVFVQSWVFLGVVSWFGLLGGLRSVYTRVIKPFLGIKVYKRVRAGAPAVSPSYPDVEG